VGCFVVNPEPEDFAQIDKFWDQVLPSSAMELDWSPKAGGPPTGIGRCINYPWAKEIKAVVVIPKKFVVPTSKARDILPEMYPSADVVRREALS
jgi:homoserine kinase